MGFWCVTDGSQTITMYLSPNSPEQWCGWTLLGDSFVSLGWPCTSGLCCHLGKWLSLGDILVGRTAWVLYLSSLSRLLSLGFPHTMMEMFLHEERTNTFQVSCISSTRISLTSGSQRGSLHSWGGEMNSTSERTFASCCKVLAMDRRWICGHVYNLSLMCC